MTLGDNLAPAAHKILLARQSAGAGLPTVPPYPIALARQQKQGSRGLGPVVRLAASELLAVTLSGLTTKR